MVDFWLDGLLKRDSPHIRVIFWTLEVERSGGGVFLECEKKANAKLRQEWGAPLTREQVLPRYKKQKKEAKSFQIRPLE